MRERKLLPGTGTAAFFDAINVLVRDLLSERTMSSIIRPYVLRGAELE